MKSHISATIDQSLVEALHRIRRRERRSLSNILETAIAEFLAGNEPVGRVVTSPGTFGGRFSRAQTYDRTKR
jgi:metal-responsive CopG/Arc/MetJ family transcriptional regulator